MSLLAGPVFVVSDLQQRLPGPKVLLDYLTPYVVPLSRGEGRWAPQRSITNFSVEPDR